MKKAILFSLVFLVILLFLYLPSRIGTVRSQSQADLDTSYGLQAADVAKMLATTYPGRLAGTSQEAQACDALEAYCLRLGYRVNRHAFTYQEISGTNLIFIKEGTLYPDREIVIGAHYDSVNTQGADDNASGVGVLLEVAARIRSLSLPCTIRFILFAAEEPGMYGSAAYISERTNGFRDSSTLEQTIMYINLDSLLGGDKLYLHSGYMDQSGQIHLPPYYTNALDLASMLGIPLETHPEVEGIPSPTRIYGSDQLFWHKMGVPYLYFEAGLYSNHSEDGNPVHKQTENAQVPGGQIMHTSFDNWDTLKSLFPRKIPSNLSAFTRLVLGLIAGMEEVEGQMHWNREKADLFFFGSQPAEPTSLDLPLPTEKAPATGRR